MTQTLTTDEAATSIKPRPFLRWAGGKTQLIEQYQPFIPATFNQYHEPFLGGGSLFFHVAPSQAYLSDLNPRLVNAWCCVRDRVDELIPLLERHRERHSSDYYYQTRDRLNQERVQALTVEDAARFIYANRVCFNGICRHNGKGEFNVPIGRHKNFVICNEPLLRSVSQRLRETRISVAPYWHTLLHAQPGDLVYFDPPYLPLSKTSNFCRYFQTFDLRDHLRLRNCARRLARRKVQVLISNSDHSLIRELYATPEFTIHQVSATRSVNSNTKRRGKITELLITTR